jgi:transcriptional regulator with GAF, ATPase, and Fis domain
MSARTPEMAGLLCDVFAEVCRHLDISDSAGGLLRALQDWLPVDGLVVRRWDEGRSFLDTVAVAGVPQAVGWRTALPTPRRDELLRWSIGGQMNHWLSRGETGLSRLLLPEDADGPWCAGPLVEAGTLVGVVLFAGNLGAHQAATQALLPPFALALANDRRVHELARLREAAEQDRQALLARLDRQDVSNAIVGAEAGLRDVMQRVDQVAPTDVPVLILGETGSGKEVVARAVHSRSRRAEGPFLRVNCGAIPPELVDSELFGHEKGSFTGAVAQRKGWFERADGGTLFLDEVGELPAAAQVRLLRVLQDGSFQRVGGQQDHTVDVRIVAATHRDMGAMVQDGRFRRDLWYRVSVFPVALPSLRERRGDIAPLAGFFAERAGMRLYGRRLVPNEMDLARLVAYSWPGNVRELASVIERAAILGGGTGLDVATALGAFSSAAAAPPAPGEDRGAIEDALRRSRGRIEGPFGAARLLGVNPHTLRSRMRRLGIDWDRYRRQEAFG